MDIIDHEIEFIAGFIFVIREDELHVDGGMASVRDDRQEDIVAFLWLAFAFFDFGDAFGEDALVGFKGRGWIGGHDLALAAKNCGQAEIVSKIGFEDDVGNRAVHCHEVGDIDEFGETRNGFVESGGLQFELGAGFAEGRGPGVEFVNAALLDGFHLHEPLKGEHFTEGIGVIPSSG